MMRHLTPRHFAVIAAVGFVVLIVTLTIIKGQHNEDAVVLAPLAPGEADALVGEIHGVANDLPGDPIGLLVSAVL